VLLISIILQYIFGPVLLYIFFKTLLFSSYLFLYHITDIFSFVTIGRVAGPVLLSWARSQKIQEKTERFFFLPLRILKFSHFTFILIYYFLSFLIFLMNVVHPFKFKHYSGKLFYYFQFVKFIGTIFKTVSVCIILKSA
jgi:hypothetical protein